MSAISKRAKARKQQQQSGASPIQPGEMNVLDAPATAEPAIIQPAEMPAYDRALFYTRITDMVNDLTNEFGGAQHSLKLFCRLLERLREDPDQAAQDVVIERFDKFIRANRKGIVNRERDQLTTHVIVYHGNINIKLAEIFRLASDDTKVTIWAHLQCLLNVLDPDNEEVEQALAAYRQSKESTQSKDLIAPGAEVPIDETSKEAKFIQSIIDEIQPSNMGGGAGLAGLDLMSMFSKVTSMLESDSGSGLDPEKLINTVQQLSTREIRKLKRQQQ